jgi:hypothetical protein
MEPSPERDMSRSEVKYPFENREELIFFLKAVIAGQIRGLQSAITTAEDMFPGVSYEPSEKEGRSLTDHLVTLRDVYASLQEDKLHPQLLDCLKRKLTVDSVISNDIQDKKTTETNTIDPHYPLIEAIKIVEDLQQ